MSRGPCFNRCFADSKRFRGAVVTNGFECAEIGASILRKGGSAVDAAIAAMLCEGVAVPQATGVGGGFFMNIYQKSTGQHEILNARETAPQRARTDMFSVNPCMSAKGGLSVGVPGELMGFCFAHQKYGVLRWNELVEPTVELCRKGHKVSRFLEATLESKRTEIMESPTLKEVFINPETDDFYREGDILKRKKLGDTLEIVAKEGASALYNGSLTFQFVKDVQSLGGILTVDDMISYRPEWLSPIQVELPNDERLYTMPLPGSGSIVAFVMNMMRNFLDFSGFSTPHNVHRIVEGFKHGYSSRTKLGDRKFVKGVDDIVARLISPAYALKVRKKIKDNKTYHNPQYYGAENIAAEDHGTANICVLSPNGDAVSITSSINLNFGAGVVTKNTGIILNDVMDDFSIPNMVNSYGYTSSPANYIVPGKRPLSSMCPSIVLDNEDTVRLVIGAAGGSKIISSVALVAIRYLWFKDNLTDAVSASRIHHQLFPMSIEFDHNYDKEIIRALKEIGHLYTEALPADGFAALTAICQKYGVIEGSADIRRQGSVVYVA